MCDHEHATLLSAFGAGREIWMCDECGALLDANSKEDQPMTPGEVNALVYHLLADKTRTIEAEITRVLREML